MKGIPDGEDYLYPLYHICIPWYLYLLYLSPYLAFWSYFEYYFNVYLHEKFNTVALLFPKDLDLTKNTNYVQQVSSDDILQLESLLNNNHMHGDRGWISKCRNLLCVHCDKTVTMETQMSQIISKEKCSDQYIINHLTGSFEYSEFRFIFDTNDLVHVQNDWINRIKTDVIQPHVIDELLDVFIPDNIWDIIIDQYCCYLSIKSDEIDYKIPSTYQQYQQLLLLFIRNSYLKTQYFDNYDKMYTLLKFYASFQWLKEFLVLISILVCFFVSDIRKQSWLGYEQLIVMLINFWFVPLNPWYIFVFGNVWRHDIPVDELYAKLSRTNNRPWSQSGKIIHPRQHWDYMACHWPVNMQKLYDYHCVKYLIFLSIVGLPYIFIILIPLLLFVMITFVCGKWLAVFHWIWLQLTCKPQIRKIIIYVFLFSILINTTFCWFNIYHKHMWIAAMVRSFLAIDQCPHAYDQTLLPNDMDSQLSVSNVFEWIAWLNYWLV